MSKFLRENLRRLEAYVAGEQPQDKKYIKLNTNESPYPPSGKVVAAVNGDEVRDLRLYCDPDASRLKCALAELYGFSPENIFLSNGSDDILNFAFMAYGAQGAAFPDITYGFYSVFAELYGVEAEVIPLTDDFSIDPRAYFGKNKLVVIANPNALTGKALPISDIEAIVESNPDSVVLIDEAYVDFGGESCMELTRKFKNLLCVGTFSKSRSLAGGRLGFAVADSGIIEDLNKIRCSTNPYNINRLTQVAGLATVLDDGYYRENCKKIIDTREYVTAEISKMGFSVIPSKANFIFAKSDEIGGEELYLSLKERGVLVRHWNKPRISEYNRITIGSREEMEDFIRIVREILEEK